MPVHDMKTMLLHGILRYLHNLPFSLHFTKIFIKRHPGFYTSHNVLNRCFLFWSYSLPKYESSHDFQTKKKRQQQRKHEEQAKRQKLQHPQQHARLPPIQNSSRAHSQHWHGPNHPMNNSQPMVQAGPSHHQYGRPQTLSGGPNRYASSGNPSGGYNSNHGGQVGGYSSAPYPPQGHGQPYGSGVLATGPRGATSGYGVPPPNYSRGQYAGAATGRGPNLMGVNRNQQYGWQQ